MDRESLRWLGLGILLAVSLLLAACGGAEPGPPPPTIPIPGEPSPTSIRVTRAPEVQPNFRFLISDEVNDIDKFQSLEITISRIGFKRAGESGKWIEVLPQTPTVDLTQLKGENAQDIWSGVLPNGQYSKAHIYVETAVGVLKEPPNRTVEIQLPGKKIKISKDFEVATGTPVAFVYDVTVKSHGNPRHGLRYHLKVQIDQSGPDQKFREVKPTKGPKVKGDLAFQLEGDINPGGAATLTLTYEGILLPGVAIDLEDAGEATTTQTGQISFQIPADTDELDLETELGGKLEVEIGQAPPQTPEASGELTLKLEGDVMPGATSTLTVSYQGSLLPNVPIKLNDAEIGFTNYSGQIPVQFPADVQTVELKAKLKGRFRLKFQGEKVSPEKFEGTIASITEDAELNSPWTVTIPGLQDPVTVFVVEVEGTPAVDSPVELRGLFLEGAIIDAKAKVQEP